MSNEELQSHNHFDGGGYGSGDGRSRGNKYRDEVYSKRVPAGKRTYCVDVKSARTGEDLFLPITERQRVDESRYEKRKLVLYKEDCGKCVSALHEGICHIKEEQLPDCEFEGLPDLPVTDDTRV